MNFKNHFVLLLSASLFLSGTVSAADTTMTMTATVVASPCTVDSESITKTIALDGGNGLQAKDLQTAGATTTWVDFDLDLSDCPAGTSKAVMTFSGTADTEDATNYKNSGTAGNIAVQIVEQGTENYLSNGKTYTKDIASGAVKYSLSARAITTKGSVTPGTVQSVITANFTYQ